MISKIGKQYIEFNNGQREIDFNRLVNQVVEEISDFNRRYEELCNAPASCFASGMAKQARIISFVNNFYKNKELPCLSTEVITDIFEELKKNPELLATFSAGHYISRLIDMHSFSDRPVLLKTGESKLQGLCNEMNGNKRYYSGRNSQRLKINIEGDTGDFFANHSICTDFCVSGKIGDYSLSYLKGCYIKANEARSSDHCIDSCFEIDNIFGNFGSCSRRIRVIVNNGANTEHINNTYDSEFFYRCPVNLEALPYHLENSTIHIMAGVIPGKIENHWPRCTELKDSRIIVYDANTYGLLRENALRKYSSGYYPQFFGYRNTIALAERIE